MTMALSPMLLPAVTYTNTPVPGTSTYICYPDCALLNILGSAFSKYRLNGKVELAYSPQTTTTDETNFTLAFADDPDHPVLGMGAWTAAASTGVGQPSVGTLKNSPNSVVFAAWATWSRTFPVDSGTVYYTTNNMANSLESAIFDDTPPFYKSELRYSHFGAVSASTNRLSADANYVSKGELFLGLDVEFFDLVPIVSRNIIPFGLTEMLKLFTPESEVLSLLAVPADGKEEDKPDARDPPPRAPPTAASSGFYRVGRGSPHLKRKAHGPMPVRQPAAKRHRSEAKHPVRLRSTRAPPSLVKVVAHLHKNRHKIPVAHHPRLNSAVSMSATKKPGWQGAVKSVVKTLVKEVPIVGPILSELTDSVGGKLLDWITDLF